MRRRPVLSLTLVAVVAVGCSSGDTPVLVDASTTVPASSVVTTAATGDTSATIPAIDAVVPEGYDLVQATITEADGNVCEVCLWLADDDDQRRAGLMFVTDLGAGDGMAFRYPEPRTGSFWMKNTVLPLSIAFFAADGAYLDAFDMEPCTTDDCPTYPTPRNFLIAIETTRGDLPELGIGPGSTLELTDLSCEPTTS